MAVLSTNLSVTYPANLLQNKNPNSWCFSGSKNHSIFYGTLGWKLKILSVCCSVWYLSIKISLLLTNVSVTLFAATLNSKYTRRLNMSLCRDLERFYVLLSASKRHFSTTYVFLSVFWPLTAFLLKGVSVTHLPATSNSKDGIEVVHVSLLGPRAILCSCPR